MKITIDIGKLYRMKRRLSEAGAELPLVAYFSVEGIKRSFKIGELLGLEIFLCPGVEMPDNTELVMQQKGEG